MKNGVLIYGCYGYTGKLISEHAVKSGLMPVLAGRDEQRVQELAQQLNLKYRVFDISDEQKTIDNIKEFKVVLHCAGPFKYTALPMAQACLKTQTHYLDITGEYQVFERLAQLDEDAQKAGVLLMPGVGFDVVPTDCLALYLKEKLPSATFLELALFHKGGKLSQGTAITVVENLGERCVVRRNKKLVKIGNGSLTRLVELDGKERKAVAISWGDVSTAFCTTKIPNIVVYNVLPQKVIDAMKMSSYFGFLFSVSFVKQFLIQRIKKRPPGPDIEEREKAKTIVWGSVKSPLGVVKQAILELPNGYTLTAWTAVKIVHEILEKEPPHGFRTPASAYGKDFILQFEGVVRSDVE